MGKKYRDLIRKHSKAKGSNRTVLNVLADYANADGIAWPRRSQIANDTGMSERNVTRCLQSLRDDGRLSVVENESGGRGRTPRYKIWVPEIGELAPKNNEEAPVKGDKKEVERVTDCPSLDDKRVTNARIKGDKSVSRIYKDLEPDKEPYISSLPASKDTTIPTEQQQIFAKVCDIVGWDYKTLDRDSKGQVAQTLGILKEAGYGLAELNRFGAEVWVHDWRWKKNKQRPNLLQLRQEIGKLRASTFESEMVKAAADAYDSPRKRMRVL